MFWYGSLEDGSCFGEISMFFDEPSQYSYAYNPQQGIKPVQLLKVRKNVFLKICRRYPNTFELMLHRAYKRKKMFAHFKQAHLLNLMKGINKSEDAIHHRLTEDIPIATANKVYQGLKARLNLFKTFHYQYELYKSMSKITHLEPQISHGCKSDEEEENTIFPG